MRAAVVEQYGTPVPTSFQEPVAADGQVVVEVAVAGVNPVDAARAAGTFYSGRQPLPFVAGGEGVGRLPDGGRVYFDRPVAPFGAMAERSLVRPQHTIALPDGIDDGVAVALGVAGLAAWMPLAWRADLQPGRRCSCSARPVSSATSPCRPRSCSAPAASSPPAATPTRSRARRSSAPTPSVRLGERTGDELTAALKDAAGGGIDVIVDPLWGAPAAAALGAISRGGRLIQIGQSAGATAELPSSAIRGTLGEIRGHTNFLAPEEVKVGAYRTMVEHAVAGRLAVEVERLPLEQVATAWEKLRAGVHGRKLVLVP